MAEPDFELLLRRPPAADLAGELSRRQDLDLDCSDAPPQAFRPEGPLSARRLHLKETLKTGRLHLRAASTPTLRKVAFFIDDSSSLRLLLGKDGPRKLGELLALWAQRHHLHAEILFSSSSAGAPEHDWDERLWLDWLKAEARWRNSLTLLVSDFHGALPGGAFWRSLLTRTSPRLLVLQHPEPELPEGRASADCEAAAPEIWNWNRTPFEAARQSWQQGLDRFLRRSAARRKILQSPDFHTTAVAALRLLSA